MCLTFDIQNDKNKAHFIVSLVYSLLMNTNCIQMLTLIKEVHRN